jgi:hypothetical protein
VFDNLLGALEFEGIAGLAFAALAAAVEPHLPRRLATGAADGAGDQFAFAGEHIGIWGDVRDGTVVALAMQRTRGPDGPDVAELEAAARALAAVGDLGARLVDDRGGRLDLRDPAAIRAWLGLPS